MMSEVIRQETLVFFLSILHGIGLSVLYDLLRALRRAFRHGLAAVSAEDFLYWLTASFFTFILIFSRTDGVLRGYVGAGIGLGAVWYHLTLSSYVVKALAAFFTLLRKMCGFVTRFLSNLVGKTCIKWKKKVEIPEKKGYNVTRGKWHRKHGGRTIKHRRGKRNVRKKEKKTQQE